MTIRSSSGWAAAAVAALVASVTGCNCGHRTGECACPDGDICREGECVPACQVDSDCPAGGICVGGTCLTAAACSQNADCGAGEHCVGGACVRADAGSSASCDGGKLCGEACLPAGSCCNSFDCPGTSVCVAGGCVTTMGGRDGGGGDAGPFDAGSSDAGSVVDAGKPDAGLPDAGCTQSCSAATCGQSDNCGGSCPPCCYQCQTGTASCTLDQVLSSGGTCPSGYALTKPACDPCWSCMNYGIAFCTSTSCCGPWQSTGVVGGGCTCYSCDGQSGVSSVSENDACYQSQQNTVALQHDHGGWCSWPSAPNTATCGYDANTVSGNAYIGTPPVQGGGCTSCSFTCGGACCMPKGNGLVSVANASQCCSGTVGPCFGSGSNCCQ